MSKPHYPRGAYGDKSAVIIELAKRPDGVTNAQAQEALGKPSTWCGGRLGKLITAGHLVRCKLPGLCVHHFTDRANAEAWVESRKDAAKRVKCCANLGKKKAPKLTPAKPSKFTGRSQHLPPGVVLAERKELQGVVAYAAGFKITTGHNWTHDPRYQLAPGERVVGGFASLGPGRYLDQ